MIKPCQEPIGAGSYKRVYPDAQNPEKKVIAEFRNPLTADQIKSIYYLGKISHILFPENIPDVDYAGNSTDIKSRFRSERVSLDKEHELSNNIYLKNEDFFIGKSPDDKLNKLETSYIYNQGDNRGENPNVKDFVDKAFRSGLFIDSGGQNFSFNDNGQVKYLDLNPAWEHLKEFKKDVLHFDPALLLESINEISDTDKKTRALAYFKRLMQLIPKKLCL